MRWLIVQVPTVLIGHPQRMTVASGFWTCGRPFVVLPCNLCNSPVEIESTPDLKHHRVRCPNCGKGTPEVIGGWLLDVLNEQRRYLDVERAYTDVLGEAYEARQALRAALGEVR